MIIDASLFYNEFELMELRLRHLAPVVDRFVVVEANLTHQGQERELLWESQWPLWKSITPNIDYVVADLTHASRGYAELEYAHRLAIDAGLERLGLRNNPTFISDADELVNAQFVKRIAMEPRPTYCRQRLHYYYLNSRQNEIWCGTVMRPANCPLSAQALREARHNPEVVEGAKTPDVTGWHWSYLGGVERIIDKLGAIYHTEVNVPPYNDPAYIRRCLAEGRDFFEPKNENKRLDFFDLSLEPGYPPEAVALVAKYPHLVE